MYSILEVQLTSTLTAYSLYRQKYVQPVSQIYQGSKMIIFESNLTTFITGVIFKGGWRNSKNWLELKIKPP
jgi:hypothetical protein